MREGRSRLPAYLVLLPFALCLGLSSGRDATSRVPRDDLEKAVYVADVGLVRSLVEQKDTLRAGFPPVLVNRRDGIGRTALMKCGYDPQVKERARLDDDCAKIARMLIGAGADISIADEKGWTALAYASAMGFTEVVGVLADAGAEIDSRDEHNRTPLMKAVANGHLRTVQALLGRQGSVDAVDNVGWTPLIFAVRNSMNGHWLETVRYLASLSVPSTLNAVDKHGRTALHYAVNIGNVEVVKTLLAAEADVAITDDLGYTAISLTDDPRLHEVLQECILKDSARRIAQWRDHRGDDVEREREERLLHALENAIMRETEMM